MHKQAMFWGSALFAMVAACGGNGHDALVATATEPAGANCPNGGVAITVGEDKNGNGVLDPGEVTQTRYVCNGADGTDGTNGTNGTNGVSYITNAGPIPDGTTCPGGGVQIQTGPDTNGNGMLDPTEVTSTRNICNGTPMLMLSSNEPAGANCADGGTKIQTGPDSNGNGVLDPGEVVATSYACNGDPSAANGKTPAVTTYSAGPVLASTAAATVVTQTASLTVPGPGTIVAIGSADVYCASPATGGGFDCLAGGITSGELTLSTSATASAASGDAEYFYLTPNDTEAMTRTAIFPAAAAGTYPVYLLGATSTGQMGFYRTQLTLLFIPN